MNSLVNFNSATARLPQAYESAKTALAQCASLDECKAWADKAAALASYAKQANDDELEQLSKRIRARAIRRAGELLHAIEPRAAEYEQMAASCRKHAKELREYARNSLLVAA